ncbi:hypothetical protein [Marinivivus vitaminiproducens]|uniref:hypothetical protein n=1 Tax=Marinivivus vitaminiproducens TaxID=3035935 RepID=UPI0027A2A86E|nr:hypothetical protein P4R82_04165 [Geminicoccaceae bacterium SCSIO 64248]
MPILYYWRRDNYLRDIAHRYDYNLNQANPTLHDIEIGESLWAFTRNRYNSYALAAELVISSKTRNPDDYIYGSYRVWGDPQRSRYFTIDNQEDITNLIRSLRIRSGRGVLGRGFQGRAAVRRIAKSDHQLLADHSRILLVNG